MAGIMGSGHELQVDGIGGGHPMTSKIAIVSRSAPVEVDVEYLFAQAGVAEAVIDTSPNCGNMLSGVGPFATRPGWSGRTDPETRVRIHNVNTGKLIEAIVQTPGGQVTYEGTAAIDGVPGTAAPIRLSFLDAAGSKTGRLLPTGSARDVIQGVEVSCIDMQVPMVIMRAADLGKTGYEAPAELDPDRAFFERLESIRRGRSAHGPGRCQRQGDPQARPNPRPAGGALARPLLHAQGLPPQPCRHRCHRHRHRLRQPGSLAHEVARIESAGPTITVAIEHRPDAFRSSSSWRPPEPRSPCSGPRSSAPRAGCSPARCSSPTANPISQGALLMLKRRYLLSAAALGLLMAGAAPAASCLPPTIRTSRSASWCPMRPAAARTPSPGSWPRV